MKYSECPKMAFGQCMLQAGDEEDITEEEMKLECMEGYKTCPYSMFATRRTKALQSNR